VIVSIHQPAYLPWLGYFDKIQRSDLFIHLDTVQFEKNSFQNRNRVLSKQGPFWLTVPVLTKGQHFDVPVKDIGINNNIHWQKKHLASIRMNYRKAQQYREVFHLIEPFYQREWEKLPELCGAMLRQFVKMLSIDSKIIDASDLPVVDGVKSDLVLNLCREVGATKYISGALGRDYLDMDSFAKAGIDVVFQDFSHPVYEQAYPGFSPGMGVIDLLMNSPSPDQVLN
jgi:hypothetical protein